MIEIVSAVGFSFCSHQQSHQVCVGQEGLLWLPRGRSKPLGGECKETTRDKNNQTNGCDQKEYDASILMERYQGPALDVMVDQGGSDNFLTDGQLLPESLSAAAASNPLISLDLQTHEGYDHSYYFISTFVDKHLDFHARHLLAQ